MKHTPAPWEVVRNHPHPVTNAGMLQVRPVHGNLLFEGSSQEICDLYCAERGGIQEANARLIASAPELLEALKDLLRDLDTVDSYALNETVLPIWEDIARAKAIIAKAEGA